MTAEVQLPVHHPHNSLLSMDRNDSSPPTVITVRMIMQGKVRKFTQLCSLSYTRSICISNIV